MSENAFFLIKVSENSKEERLTLRHALIAAFNWFWSRNESI
jgi:hypothetical protein